MEKLNGKYIIFYKNGNKQLESTYTEGIRKEVGALIMKIVSCLKNLFTKMEN